MDTLLKQVMNHLKNWNVSFGYGNPEIDGVSANILSTPIAINRFKGSKEKISQITIYCLYTNFLEAFSTASQIYEYLSKNKIISNDLKILNVTGPTRVVYKQNKHLFIVEFEIVGL